MKLLIIILLTLLSCNDGNTPECTDGDKNIVYDENCIKIYHVCIDGEWSEETKMEIIWTDDCEN